MFNNRTTAFLKPNKLFSLPILVLIILLDSSYTLVQAQLIALPDNIWVTERTGDSISVAWTPVNDARLQSYNLRLNGRYAGWTRPGVTNFTFNELQRDATYTLGVLSVEVPAKVYSDDISVTASIDLPRPTDIWITDQTPTSISIGWAPVSDNRLQSYNLRIDGSYAAWTPPGVTTYTFEDLQPNTNYSLGVLSVEVPAQTYSDDISITATTDTDVLKAPDQIQVSNSTQTSVTVSWTPVTGDRLHSYNLALDGAYAGWTSADKTEFTFNGLTPGSEHVFGVRSVQVPEQIYSSLTTISHSTDTSACAGSERFSTAVVNGVPHGFVDRLGSPQSLSGINVRSPLRSNNTLRYSQDDINAIASQGFDHIRIPLDWYEFETAKGEFNTTRLAALDQFIDTAAQAGLHVILDPIHLKNDQSANYWGVPSWAWGTVSPDRTKVFDELVEHALPYLKMMTLHYCDVPTVIGIDLVNEPRQPGRGNLFAQNQELVEMYIDWIAELRTIDSDKPFLLEPFYGMTAVDASTLAWLGQYDNIIWSVHDYYAGEGSPDDGFSAGGFASVQPRTESWNSAGNYPSIERRGARADMSKHILVQKNAAAMADIPIHIGEYGIPKGWSGKWGFHCDKTTVYNQLKIPRTAWVWNQDIDGGFGMWNPDGGWLSWVEAITNPVCQ